MAGRSQTWVVVVADDFGSSSSVNRAVAEANEAGIVMSASLMAGGEAFEEAIALARKSGTLSLGLHLTLCDGAAVLPGSAIPDLVDANGRFEKNPASAWLKYMRRSLLFQIEKEIVAQFDRLEKAGIHPSHVDGHHHIHMHPAIFSLVCRHAAARRVRWIRIPNEPFSMVLRAGTRGLLPLAEWVVFRLLALSHRKQARQCGLRVAGRVYGLSRTGRLDERHLLRILNRPHDFMEIFSHPDSTTRNGQRELEALTSQSIRNRISLLGMKLAGYGDLSRDAPFPDAAQVR